MRNYSELRFFHQLSEKELLKEVVTTILALLLLCGLVLVAGYAIAMNWQTAKPKGLLEYILCISSSVIGLSIFFFIPGNYLANALAVAKRKGGFTLVYKNKLKYLALLF